MPSQPTPLPSVAELEKHVLDLRDYARRQDGQITSLQAEVQNLQSRSIEQDAVVQYQQGLLEKAQSDLVETRVNLLREIRLAQPSIPTTVLSANTSNPAGRPVRDVAASTISDNNNKNIEESRAGKTEENIEGWLRVLHQGKGEELVLKVVVDMGATVNTITLGMLIDHQLVDRKIRLKKPHVLNLVVGTFGCSEQISIKWMGKGNAEHGTSTFYVLRPGQANMVDRAILSKDEWLNRKCLLYEKYPSHLVRQGHAG
ncbi:hypothetical protein F5883DRAFT_266661 [Diaporthe sp. PMI_573]|nr:hypothetical protein F5883DRAFT_266661 [Diaporthaceae sp. PMI_573]